MKTIQLSDQLFDTLSTIAHLVQKQDNRATASPYFFRIREKERVYGIEDGYEDGWVWVDADDHETSFDPQSDINEILEHLCESGTAFSIKKFHQEEFYRDETMEEAGFKKVGYKDIFTFKNTFFTEAGIRAHLQANRHHYEESAVDYMEHAFRNPEMDAIFHFFQELAAQTDLVFDTKKEEAA